MKNMILRVCVAALAIIAIPVSAQVVRLPVVTNTAGSPTSSTASVLIGSNGAEKGTSGNPLITHDPSGGGGGPVTVADGADVTQGAKADAAAAGDTSTASVVALIKRNNQNLTTINTTLVTGIPVTGTFWQATQPVSGTVTANAGSGTFTISGAITCAACSTSALQTTMNTTLGSPMQNSGGTVTVTQATAANFNATVIAPLANLSTSAANPFLGAGRYNTTFPTLTNGQLSELQLAIRGGLRVQLVLPDTAGNIDYLNGTADARPTSINGLSVASYGFAFDGTAFPRLRTITGSDGTGLGMTGVSIAPNSIAPGAIAACISASAAETSKICKASAGNYYDGYCQSSAAGRCILYNSTTVPGAGALTAALVLECVTVPAGGSGSWAYGDIPRRASTGMVILFSTGGDCNTYTASSTAYIHGSVM